ncbi:sensor histidine kinase [Paenibacillus arenilitoris]|uniref:histidine kinase n=1 Tax=Paenibacillus arenilitoris TaxID=2772299 RepID=A0A927H4V4_9BACL|nr:sensor histidine kinase [Paenibacillus arenilitoris]MBD2868816.1 sensor histidine kinase [Paenibacillus arenilitoris]
MSIVLKMIWGYVVLILIPMIALGSYMYSFIYDNLSQQFVESRQKILEQAYANMKADLTRIASVHRVLQYNPYVTAYLDGEYHSDKESVYAYLRYISPAFTQSMFANQEISSLMIYKMKDHVMPIPEQFLEVSSMDPEVGNIVRSLKPGSGQWTILYRNDNQSELVYLQSLYNTLITEKIGILQIHAGDELLRKFYQAAGVEGNWRAYLLSETGNSLLTDEKLLKEVKPILRLVNSNPQTSSFIDRKTIVNQMYLEELDVRVVIVGQISDVFHAIREKEMVIVAVIVGLLTIFSVSYYFLASFIAKRILQMARHMRSVNDGNLKPMIVKLERPGKQDEIGFLIVTYNNMIDRMEKLINNVHRAELRNKEAAYRVLQAQIKPHFLYNTLETIRMLAETNNDKEVADISFWFGKLMRYSLTTGKDVTMLDKEIEIIRFYLNIHKKRLQERLTYDFAVMLDASSMPCPKFILQPLIENCIVHSVSNVLRHVRIRMEAYEEMEEVRIVISDNGVGIPPERLREIRSRLDACDAGIPQEGESGWGLYNVAARVKSFYGGSSRLEIESELGKGTVFTLYLTRRTVNAG